LPSKPTAALNRAAFGALKGLSLKADAGKGAKTTAASMDDAEETTRTLETLGDMPAIDMTMADGQATIGDLEGDDDDDEANRVEEEIKAKAKDAMEVDEEEVDPLDAFMSSVKEEVKKVNAEDMKRMGLGGRSRISLDDPSAEDGPDVPEGTPDVDELDTTELNPEDILALAAKKARKKDLAAVDHARVAYEPFRKEFYATPPEVAAMSDEEADLVRLELDGIKIRGVDCPRPVTKWSHFGLPASWYVVSFLDVYF
jgi:ATP-dependent RNA helicase DDX46/PRP5